MKFVIAFLVTTIGTVLCAMIDSNIGLSPAYGYLAGAVVMSAVVGVFEAYDRWQANRTQELGTPAVTTSANGTVTVNVNGARVTIDRNGNISCVSTPGDYCMGSRS